MVMSTEIEKKKPRKKRSGLPAMPSSLTVAFEHLSGGWRSYIRFVEIAAKDKDEEMQKLLDHYRSLSKAKRADITPESLCLDAGVNIKDFLGSIMPWIWIYSNSAAAVIAATANPAVIAKTARAAMGQGKFAHKDRETFLKVTGALPSHKGSQTIINNTPVANATAGASSGLPIRLPSAGQDVMELEAGDMDNTDG